MINNLHCFGICAHYRPSCCFRGVTYIGMVPNFINGNFVEATRVSAERRANHKRVLDHIVSSTGNTSLSQFQTILLTSAEAIFDPRIVVRRG